VDITDEAAPRWVDTQVNGSDLLFGVESGHRYLAVGRDKAHRADVRRARSSPLKRSGNRADYLVIGPREFLAAARDLLSLRESQGLRVKEIPIDEVFEEFGFGEPRPEAIQEFLSYAYHRWSGAPRYVLLLGDATYDFKDRLGTGVNNHVPPLMVKTSSLWTVSDPSLAMINGEDPLPDVSIGRIPAADVDELRAMVDKILAYETEGRDLSGPAILVADDADGAGNFEADAEDIAFTFLRSRETKKIYLSKVGVPATREAIVEALDEGASLMSYLGHGGIHLWGNENLFNRDSVAALSPQSTQPLVLTLNCLNGYFHFPYFDSLSEALVKADGKGAIAAFSPSGMSFNGPAHRYHKALLTEILGGGHQRLGDAVLAAQGAYAETGALPELLSIYHLFGDPALTLR